MFLSFQDLHETLKNEKKGYQLKFENKVHAQSNKIHETTKWRDLTNQVNVPFKGEKNHWNRKFKNYKDMLLGEVKGAVST